MVIFFKCSFRSSHGFSNSKYDVNRKKLIYLSEKSSNSNGLIPKTIEYTLSHQLGRCLILGTDESGYYFFGVYRLIEGNDDKYVNAVFYDPNNPKRILALYDYFCNNQQSATQRLLDCICRSNDEIYESSNLEYIVRNDSIQSIFSNVDMNTIIKEPKIYPPNTLLAFITTDEYIDYQIALEERFHTEKTFRCEHYDINSNNITNYQLAVKNVYKSFFPFPIPLLIGGGIGVIVAIIALLISFL